MDNMEWLTPDYDEDMWENADVLSQKIKSNNLLVQVFDYFKNRINTKYSETALGIIETFKKTKKLSVKQKAVLVRCLAPFRKEVLDYISIYNMVNHILDNREYNNVTKDKEGK